MSPRTWHLFSLQPGCLGVPGEAAPSAKALHLQREQGRRKVPGKGTAAERSLADCSFVWAKTSLGSATGNKKAGGGAVKIPAISQRGPRLPSPPFPFPPAGSGCANKGFQASLGKRQEEAEVRDGRGSGAAPGRGDPGPAARSEPQVEPGGKRPRSEAGRAGTGGGQPTSAERFLRPWAKAHPPT